jgi:hypothetical protein
LRSIVAVGRKPSRRAAQCFPLRSRVFVCYTFVIVNVLGEHRVGIALKLDVLAAFAAIAFVGAILLGAF